MRKLFSFLFAAVLIAAVSLPSDAAVTGISAKPVRVLVKALSTSNLTLSGAQTIDSVAVVAGDLVGAVGQSDNANGVYLVQSGAWKAANPGFGTGLEIYALAGGSNANKVYGADTTGAITWGSTAVTFTLKSSSGAAFSPAAPGAIGGTTPAAGTFTTLVGNTSASSPVYIITESGGPVSTASTTKLWRANTGIGDHVVYLGGTGDKLLVEWQSGSGTSDIRKRYWSKSLADDATFDITIGGGGHGTITAPGASGSSSCSFSFAVNGATTDNGLTGTNCAVADSDTKLCAYAGAAGHVIIKNRLGSTQTILIEMAETASN